MSFRAASRYKLFDYAAGHWAHDFLRCSVAASQESLEAASVICGFDRIHLTNWLRYFWISKDLAEPCLHADPLIVASYFGHVHSLQAHLDSPSLVMMGDCGPAYSGLLGKGTHLASRPFFVTVRSYQRPVYHPYMQLLRVAIWNLFWLSLKTIGSM